MNKILNIISVLNNEIHYEKEHKALVNSNVYKLNYEDNSQYTGLIEDELPQGYGTANFLSGSTYTGHFKKGEMHGDGVYTSSDFYIYNGQFSHNKKNGQGIETYSNDCYYKGEFKDNKKEGKGMFISKSLEYNGQFKDNNFNGKGNLLINDISIQGLFKNGQPNSSCIVTYPNGESLQGNFVNGKKEGVFEFRAKYLSTFKNFSFSEDKLMEILPEVKGKKNSRFIGVDALSNILSQNNN